MKDSLLEASDAQTFTDPDSTGEVTTNVLDMEQDSDANTIITDDQLEGYMNVIITSAALTSGGDEGISLIVRNGDNSDCATGAEDIGKLDVPLASVVTGAKFSVPFKRDVGERYVGGWLAAKSTTYTGAIILEVDFSYAPISENESIQKVTS